MFLSLQASKIRLPHVFLDEIVGEQDDIEPPVLGGGQDDPVHLVLDRPGQLELRPMGGKAGEPDSPLSSQLLNRFMIAGMFHCSTVGTIWSIRQSA